MKEEITSNYVVKLYESMLLKNFKNIADDDVKLLIDNERIKYAIGDNPLMLITENLSCFIVADNIGAREKHMSGRVFYLNKMSETTFDMLIKNNLNGVDSIFIGEKLPIYVDNDNRMYWDW